MAVSKLLDVVKKDNDVGVNDEHSHIMGDHENGVEENIAPDRELVSVGVEASHVQRWVAVRLS